MGRELPPHCRDGGQRREEAAVTLIIKDEELNTNVHKSQARKQRIQCDFPGMKQALPLMRDNPARMHQIMTGRHLSGVKGQTEEGYQLRFTALMSPTG